MKVFIAVALLAMFVGIQAVTEEQKEKIRQHGVACLEETGAEKEQVKKLKLGEASGEVDSKVKCFVRCFFRRSGFFDGNDVFQREVAVTKLGLDADTDAKKSIEEAVDQCKDKTDEDTCEKAYQIYKCYQDLKHVSLV